MSTKKIEQVLHMASMHMHVPTELYDEALNELEALRSALARIQNGEESTIAWALVGDVAKEASR